MVTEKLCVFYGNHLAHLDAHLYIKFVRTFIILLGLSLANPSIAWLNENDPLLCHGDISETKRGY